MAACATTSIVGADDDGLPWSDPEIVHNCEVEAFGAYKASENKDEQGEKAKSLAWALVHSRLAADVIRGIGMLPAIRDKSTSPAEKRESLYLLAVAHYRTGNYRKSRECLESCLMIESDWEQALILQKLLTQRTRKDGTIGMIIATGTIGVLGFAVGGVIGAFGAVALAASGVAAMGRHA